jgi:hypothetical protein
VLGLVLSGCCTQAAATPLYVGNFEAMLDSGFGGLPPTLLSVRYTFQDKQPVSVRGRSAEYELRSISVRLNGVEFSAVPFALSVEDGTYYQPGVRRDQYFVFGAASGIYATYFEIDGAGLSFEKYGNPPRALNDLKLPTSIKDLSGFTIEHQYDQRHAVLTFANLETGGLFATSAPMIRFSIEPVAEPGTLVLLGIGLFGLGLAHPGRSAARSGPSWTRSPR